MASFQCNDKKILFEKNSIKKTKKKKAKNKLNKIKTKSEIFI